MRGPRELHVTVAGGPARPGLPACLQEGTARGGPAAAGRAGRSDARVRRCWWLTAPLAACRRPVVVVRRTSSTLSKATLSLAEVTVKLQ